MFGSESIAKVSCILFQYLMNYLTLIKFPLTLIKSKTRLQAPTAWVARAGTSLHTIFASDCQHGGGVEMVPLDDPQHRAGDRVPSLNAATVSVLGIFFFKLCNWFTY